MRQRGFAISGLLGYGIAAAAIIAGLIALYWWVDKSGYSRCKAEWEEANRKAEREETAAQIARADIVFGLAAERNEAHDKAQDAERKLKEARDAAKRSNTQLAVCRQREPQVVVVEGAPSSEARDLGVDVYVTWGFVSLHDAAWTDQKGQPVFGTAEAIRQANRVTDPNSSSPAGIERVLDTDEANAKWCSKVVREHDSLLEALRKLEADWNKHFGG